MVGGFVVSFYKFGMMQIIYLGVPFFQKGQALRSYGAGIKR